MSFGQAVKSVWSQYATFTGRARRSEYWWFQLFSALLSVPTQIFFWVMFTVAIAMSAGGVDANGELQPEDVAWGLLVVGVIPMMVVGLGLFVPSLAVLVRRLHDTGRSGWWYFISLVPGASIVLLVFAVLDGQPFDNYYGPDVKAAERYPVGGYAQPAQYAQPPQYAQPAQYAQPPAQSPVNPEDPYATPGR